MGFSKKFIWLIKNSRFWPELFENVFLVRISFFLRLKKRRNPDLICLFNLFLQERILRDLFFLVEKEAF